jgi:outer membrane immunogenic protein
MLRNFALGLLTAGLLVSSAAAEDRFAPGPSSWGAPAWSGLYVGIQGGRAWGTSIQDYNAGTTDRFGINGWQGGATVGYNWQVERWVLGIEADASRSNIDGSTVSTATYNCGTICSTNVTSFETVRGRVGHTWNNMLLYGTAGWAHGNIRTNLDGGVVDNARSGLVIGAGAEFQLNRNWSAKLEWDRVDFGHYQWTNASNANFSCTGINCSTDARFNVIRAGLNYRFSFDPAPAPLK